ncbi:nuclear transport factor 2 family protein [Janthinobacterium sp. 17J80-10]|uniref:nuclear transport factor 2 family protein n=1 Tax=Janthinobacterium sp. 17J80-10 TaxID=2497863 RepID=UPI00100599DC|nr:nuclear transport factor 2 family protein [Janthinobacterium sp. 17J80-10]QAU33715.1 nuclear transport factor 2 family protein [Janthinobacterium sp. 17J80-10]
MDSQQNKQMVLRGYELFQAGDIQELLQLFSDDIEWIGSPVEFVPFSGNHHGKQEVAEFFMEMDSAQEAELFEPQDVIAEGDKVVVTGNSKWIVKATGQSYDSPWVHVFTIQDGKIIKFQEYNDTAAGRAAFLPRDSLFQDTNLDSSSLLH